MDDQDEEEDEEEKKKKKKEQKMNKRESMRSPHKDNINKITTSQLSHTKKTSSSQVKFQASDKNITGKEKQIV